MQVIISEILGTPSSINKWYSSEAFVSNYYSSGATTDMIGITGNEFLQNENNWDCETLAICFMVCYERPSYDSNTNHYEQRKANALKWYNYLKNYDPTPEPEPTTHNENFKKWGCYLTKKKILIRR